jgi:uncharacterized phage infection (PIP) family protein YhgE
MVYLPFTSNVNRDSIDPKSIFVITTETIVFGVSGLVLGTIVNNLFTILSKKYKNYTIIISILQIAFSGALLGILYVHVSSYFTNYFQRTLSGIAFPALFYSIQSNIFLPWHSLHWNSLHWNSLHWKMIL